MRTLIAHSSALLFLAPLALLAQPFVPGQTYFSPNGHIEYRCGELPLIIAAPHGGLLAPTDMPDRTCNNAVWVNDANTMELAMAIDSVFAEGHGCRPHLIINHLQRRKMDGNRNQADATCGDPQAITAWNAFHGFINSAKQQVSAVYGRGFFLDLHGHGHAVQRMELGYLLYEDELALDDAQLNSTQFINWSSLRHLANDNVQGLPHADLLRGAQALGTRLAERGYPSVPSAQDPFPLPGQPYFSGGYNTVQHSSYLGGTIDGVQLECNMSGVRDTAPNRARFADSLRVALTEYLTTHLFGDPGALACLSTGMHEHAAGSLLQAYPTLVDEVLRVQVPDGPAWIEVLDTQGRVAWRAEARLGEHALWLSHLRAGPYIVRLKHADGRSWHARIVKR